MLYTLTYINYNSKRGGRNEIFRSDYLRVLMEDFISIEQGFSIFFQLWSPLNIFPSCDLLVLCQASHLCNFHQDPLGISWRLIKGSVDPQFKKKKKKLV